MTRAQLSVSPLLLTMSEDFAGLLNSGVPTCYNLHRWAQTLLTEPARWLTCSDSRYTQENSATRMPAGNRDALRPLRWAGHSGNSAQNILNYSGSVSPEGVFGPEANSTTYYDTNRWSMVAGTRALETTGASPDVSVAKVTGLSATNFSPNAYREIVFKGTANGDAAGTGNVPNGVAVWGFAHHHDNTKRFNSFSQPSETVNIGGDWTCGNDALRARLIYFRNPNGPTSLQWTPTRNNVSAGTAVTINASGAESVQFVDCDVNASAGPSAVGTRVVARLIATGSGGTGSADDESNKVLPLIGYRLWRPNTQGLEASYWCNSGWNSSHFVSTSLVADVHLEAWLQAYDFPTHVTLDIGQNQTTAETTELDAGVATEYKNNIRAVMDRLSARYSAMGRAAPQYELRVPYDSSRSALNYATMARGLYEIAVERQLAYLNLLAMHVCPRTLANTDASSVLLNSSETPPVHPTLTGAQYFMSLANTAYHAALAGSRPGLAFLS